MNATDLKAGMILAKKITQSPQDEDARLIILDVRKNDQNDLTEILVWELGINVLGGWIPADSILFFWEVIAVPSTPQPTLISNIHDLEGYL